MKESVGKIAGSDFLFFLFVKLLSYLTPSLTILNDPRFTLSMRSLINTFIYNKNLKSILPLLRQSDDD